MTDHVIQPYDYDIIAMDCHILYYNYMIRPCFLCLSLPSHVLFHNHYHEFHDHNCNDDISICNIYIYKPLQYITIILVVEYSIVLHPSAPVRPVAVSSAAAAAARRRPAAAGHPQRCPAARRCRPRWVSCLDGMGRPWHGCGG